MGDVATMSKLSKLCLTAQVAVKLHPAGLIVKVGKAIVLDVPANKSKMVSPPIYSSSTIEALSGQVIVNVKVPEMLEISEEY